MASTLFRESASSWVFGILSSLPPPPAAVAEISRLCKPLLGRSDFCWDYWRAWLFLRGCAWTWYWVTAWHPVLSPHRRWEKWRVQATDWEALVHAEQWLKVCRQCRRLASRQASLPRTVKGFCLCKAGAFLHFGWESPAWHFYPFFSLQSQPPLNRTEPSNATHFFSQQIFIVFLAVSQALGYNSRLEAPCTCVMCFWRKYGVLWVHWGGPCNPNFEDLGSAWGGVMLSWHL